MSSPAPAVWYFDVISPFAYIAWPRLAAIRARRAVICRPVLFAGLLKHWGQLGPAEIGPKRTHTYRLAAHTAMAQGQPFRFPPAHPFNPLALLRLLTALDGAPEAVERALSLVWGEGRDATAPDTAMELAGLADAKAVDQLIEQTGSKERLRAATDEAIAAGVFGVPTLALDGELFWGSDALDMALAFLSRPSLFRSGELARAERIPAAAERRR